MQAKKQFGQNFLTDLNKVNEIINFLDLNKDVDVVEVGPGMGALTYDMTKLAKRVRAIEVDEDMVNILDKGIENLEIVHSDVLDVDFKKMVTEETAFVSNLPYYISSKILFKVMDHDMFTSASVMMQKELVDRIYSNHGTKEYGRLSVAVRTFFDVEKIIKVPRECFTPSPNVDSAFIVLRRSERTVTERTKYLTFIRHSFAMKRKKFINSLKNSGSEYTEQSKQWLVDNDLPETTRAEQITVEQFMDMWESFNT